MTLLRDAGNAIRLPNSILSFPLAAFLCTMVVERAEALLRRKGSLAQQLKSRSSTLGESSEAIGSTQFATSNSSYVRRPGTQFESGAAAPAGFSVSTAGYAASVPFRDVLIQEVTLRYRSHHL